MITFQSNMTQGYQCEVLITQTVNYGDGNLQVE